MENIFVSKQIVKKKEDNVWNGLINLVFISFTF